MAIDLSSPETIYADLLPHIGHDLELVTYGPNSSVVNNIAIECRTCEVVLVDADASVEVLPMPNDGSDELVGAEAHSDDRVVEVKFSVADWLRDIDTATAVALAREGWGYCAEADDVARECMYRVPGLRALFRYLDTADCGFEVAVNEDEAMAWLAKYRPSLHAEILARLEE